MSNKYVLKWNMYKKDVGLALGMPIHDEYQLKYSMDFYAHTILKRCLLNENDAMGTPHKSSLKH